MIYKIEIECPYCGRIHIYPVEVGIPEISEEQKEDKKSGDQVDNPDVV